MKKQLTTLAVMGILLGQTHPVAAAEIPTPQATVKQITLHDIVGDGLRSNKVDPVIAKLKKRIGKTWYVFSGSSPAGWDCSGLTRWAYEQLGVDIPHSANKQARLGVKVATPEIGDLVLFGYKGTNTFFHASIYIGNNKVIHAGFKRGQTTSILDLGSASVKNTKMRFVRLDLNG